MTEVYRTIVVLGAAGGGKTALITRYGEDQFAEVYEPTLESNYTISTTHRGNSLVLRLREIGAGAFNPRVTAGVDGYMLVFNICSEQSYKTVLALHDTLSSLVGDAAVVPRILVGSHGDASDDREVPSETARRQANAWQCPYVEASAKSGTGVSEAFQLMLEEIDAVDTRHSATRQASTKSARRRSARNSSPATAACCELFMQLITLGRYRPQTDPTDNRGQQELRRGLLVDVDADNTQPSKSPTSARSAPEFQTLQSPSSRSPFARTDFGASPYSMGYPIRMEPPDPRVDGYTGSEMEVGSIKTGIQLAPYPPQAHPQSYFSNSLPSSASSEYPATAPMLAVSGPDGRLYFVPAYAVSAASVGQPMPQMLHSDLAARAEDGSTGGTPHFDVMEPLQRAVAGLQARSIAAGERAPPYALQVQEGGVSAYPGNPSEYHAQVSPGVISPKSPV